MMRVVIAALALALAALAGCSSFKLGTMLYAPHGQSAALQVQPPAPAASAP